jgi:hypothetical protein
LRIKDFIPGEPVPGEPVPAQLADDGGPLAALGG